MQSRRHACFDLRKCDYEVVHSSTKGEEVGIEILIFRNDCVLSVVYITDVTSPRSYSVRATAFMSQGFGSSIASQGNALD